MDLELAPFDVRECVEAVVDLIGPVAQRKGLELTYGIEPGTPETAVGDTSRLRQILLNLLSNAVKFTDEGEIAVHVEQAESPERDRIAFHVSIRDTGIGIPPIGSTGSSSRSRRSTRRPAAGSAGRASDSRSAAGSPS